jgi:hypothetical protein
MAYILLDDMAPESSEYSTNYIYFDEKKTGMMKKMMKLCRQKGAKKASKKPAYELVCEYGCTSDWRHKLKCSLC